MSEKSVRKKQFIVETARKVFMEKGFKNVTMKDIVDACGISRGGLYLYFENTADLFGEVLRLEREEENENLLREAGDNAAPSDLLLLYLREQKKEILRKKNNLSMATYEYFFEVKPPRKENAFRKWFMEELEFLTGVIDAGVESGEFSCEDPEASARNILFVLEGLRVCGQTMGLSEGMMDRELLYIMQGLVCEEE